MENVPKVDREYPVKLLRNAIGVSKENLRFCEWCARHLEYFVIAELSPPDYCFSCARWDDLGNQYGEQCADCRDGDLRIPG